MFASVLGLPADDWTAIAAWLTAGVAATAAVAALRQVREARRLRAEQAQPYVVAFLEETGVSRFVDLVIKNLGGTAATDVTVDMDPPPERALAAKRSKFSPLVPDQIPVLVPQQEWRTLFDTTQARGESDLPRRYTAEVSFKDSRKRESYAFSYVLDWELMINRASVVEYGMHDLAKAARDVSREVKRWSGPGARGLSVSMRRPDVPRRTAGDILLALRNSLRRLVGLPRVAPGGLIADVWWGAAARRRERWRKRVGRTRIGRATQRWLSD